MTSREQIYKAALEADVERGKYQPWGRARHSDVVVRWKCHACHDYYSPVVLVSDAGYCRNEECPSVKARAALEAAAKVGDSAVDAYAFLRSRGWHGAADELDAYLGRAVKTANFTRLDTAGSKARDLYHHQNELACMRPGVSYDGHEHGWSHRYECDEWAALEREWQALVNAARVEGFLEGIKSTASHADERADAVERSPMASSPWAKAVAPALRVFAKDMRESADEAMAEVAPLTPAAPRGD